MNIKKVFGSFNELFYGYIKKFFVSFVFICIAGIVLAADLELIRIFNLRIEKIYIFTLFIFFAMSFFISKMILEVKNIQNKVFRCLIYAIPLIASFIVILDCTLENADDAIFVYSTNALRITIFFIYLFSLCAFMSINNNNKKASEFLLHFLYYNIILSVIEIIFTIGIFTIGFIFSVLFFDANEFFLKLWIFLCVFLPGNGTLLFLSKCNFEKTNLINNLVKFIMFPLFYISFIIVYSYFVKILITRNVPSNGILMIGNIIFETGAPINLMITSMKGRSEKSIVKFDIIQKISYIFPILFIPVFAFQIYAIAVRIYYYGMTEIRYFAVMWLIFEFVYIVYYIITFFIIKNEFKLKHMCIVVAILCTVTLYAPFINYNDFVKIYNDKFNIEREYDGGSYVANYDKKADLSFYGHYNVNSMNVSNYNNLYRVKSVRNVVDKKVISDNTYDFYYVGEDNSEKIEINMEKLLLYIRDIIEYRKDENSEYYNKTYYAMNDVDNVILLDDGILYIESFYVRTNINDGSILEFDVDAILLTK